MKIVVLSGSGISAESGLKTFRGADGLWEGHRVEDVATPEAWQRSPEAVLRFYNERRRQLRGAKPNEAHRALARLETVHEVTVVTQNVDDLHERSGSTRVLHLHGELMKARSSVDESLVYSLGERDIELGDECELGSQLRPHIVWFGEMVPEMERAAKEVSEADALIVVGTSLLVYPAASLIYDAPPRAERYLVDPEPVAAATGFEVIAKPAVSGLPPLVERLLLADGR